MASLVVYTTPPLPDCPHVFPDGRYKVDEAGTLHVFRLRDGKNHMLGTYAPASGFAARFQDDA